MSELKILMAVPQYPYPVTGGLERQSHELAKDLLRKGVKVTVISSRFDASQGVRENVDGVEVYRVAGRHNSPVNLIRKSLGIFFCMYRLRHEYDLVHVHNPSWFSMHVVNIARLLRKPTLSKMPNVGSCGIPGMLERGSGRYLVKTLKRSSAIVAMSLESVLELLEISYPENRIFRITNGVAAGDFIRNQQRSEDTGEPLRTVFCGRLSPEKGLVDLIPAWKEVVRCVERPVILDIYGDGPQEEELRALINSLGLENSVRLHGHVDDIPAVLQAADVFVLPSYAEGNSNAILEAMAMGLPIVSTLVGGTEMMVGPEGRRFLLCPGDRNALQERLVELLGDDAARRRLSVAMRTRIEKYFDIPMVAVSYIKAYRALLKNDLAELGRASTDLF